MMKLKQIRKFFNSFTRTVDRILIVPEKCFPDDEFELWCIGGLTQETTERIVKNFNAMVKEVISLSAKGKKIYVECIGSADEHFVVALTMERKK